MLKTLTYLKEYSQISRWLLFISPAVYYFTIGYWHSDSYNALAYIWMIVAIWVFYNFFLYSVNDLSDIENDTYQNQKSIRDSQIFPFLKYLIPVNLALFALPFAFYGNVYTWIALIALGVISIFYSLEPLRFKNKPILDFVSSSLGYCTLPYVLGSSLQNFDYFNWQYILSRTILVAALHLVLEMRDIAADTHAKDNTTAVLLGYYKTFGLMVLLIGLSYYIAPFSKLLIFVVLLALYLAYRFREANSPRNSRYLKTIVIIINILVIYKIVSLLVQTP